MAELDTAPNFGIEDTIGGVGNQELLDGLLDTESSTADPKDISSLEDENTEGNTDDGKGPDGKADPTKLAGKDDNVPAASSKDPDALTDFLLGGGEEEEEEEEENKNVLPADAPAAATDANDGNDDGNDDNSPTPPSTDGIAFDSLSKELSDLSVFTSRGEEDVLPQTAEEFLERFKEEKQIAANQMVSDFIGQFGTEHQEAFDAIYVKGADPKTYFAQAAKVQDFSNLDLTVEANQERVVRETLKDQEFDAEDIDKEIEKLKNYGDLEDVSKRHHKVLIKKEAKMLEQTTQEAQEATQYKLAQKEEYVNNVRSVLTKKLEAKEFDGIPLNPNTANELQDFLLVDKWKTKTGETLTDFDKTILDLKDPANHEQKVKVALLLKLLEKDPTLSTIQKRGVSTKTSQLFKDVARQKTSATRAEANKQPAKSWFK
jgi:hypothetical protein